MTKLVLAAAAALLIAGPALAEASQGPDSAPARSVSVRGVDFSSADQTQRFYAALNGAADAVCAADASNPRPSEVDASCKRQVMAQAVKVANKPVLTALYDHAQPAGRAFAGNDQ